MEDLITLVSEVRGGSEKAFTILVGRFRSLAFGLAYSALRDHHLAEDTMQDAFGVAYQCMHKLEDPGAFPGWFRTLLVRQIRKVQRKFTRTASLMDAVAIPSHLPQPLEAMTTAEDSQRVHMALSQLPEYLRITTVLFYFHDSKVGEIAQFLEVPATTVKKRLVDARRKLKLMWDTVELHLPRMKQLASPRSVDCVRNRSACVTPATTTEILISPEEPAMTKDESAFLTKTAPRDAMADVWLRYKAAPTEELRNQIIEHYVPLVHGLAKRMAARLPSHIETDDLVAPAVFGLMDAIESFDLERGIKFETFAARRIQGAMLDEIRSQDWVPRLVRTRCQRIDQASRQFAMRHGRPATEEDLKHSTGLNAKDFARIKNDAHEVRMSSIHRPAARNSDDREMDQLSIADHRQSNPITAVERLCLKEVVLRGMTRAERLIVVLYYYEQMTMKEIGATLDLSESRVSQMHSSILARLKARMTPQDLEGVMAGA